MQKEGLRSAVKLLLPIMLAFAAVLMFQDTAYAGTVAPSGDGSDYSNIVAELESTGSVKLQSGGEYHLSNKIYLESGWTIDAAGATIYVSGMLFNHDVTSTGYDSVSDITINGGTWLSESSSGYATTLIHFTHANNITLKNMDIEACNYSGHTIELVACKDVTIKNCTITPLGKPSSTSVEEQIQIDIAAPATAPFLSSTYTNGRCCKNIKIIGCTVTGARAICANYAASDKGKYLKGFHENITIKNCTLTGETAEALALFNTSSAKVTGNTIITKAPTSRDSYSVGCHFHLFGTSSKASSGKITVSKNTIKGGRQALQFYSHSSSNYGKVTIKNNKLYCRKGASSALKASNINKLSQSGNKTYSW